MAHMDSQRITSVVAGTFCAIAILNLPYGFYMLLRCVATGAAIYLLTTARVRLAELQVFILIVAILIFNPIWKVPLGREIWRIVDGISAAFYFWISATLKNKND
jgi:NADH:ubiquinone oxidoreductase subunit 6 (subunit J)